MGIRPVEHKFLAVGGTHVIERQARCALVAAEPTNAVRDLGWTSGALALAADREGRATADCDGERIDMEIVSPARLEVQLEDRPPTDLVLHEPFRVRAHLYDRHGHELEVGKLTPFEWSASGVLELAHDRSSGEFGFCDTCFGMHQFRGVRTGQGSVEARLGGLTGTLRVETRR